MKTLEFYFYEKHESHIRGRSERGFYVYSVHGESGVYARFIDGIAKEVDGLFCKVNDVYLIDKIIFYSSLNKDIKGKPHVIVTRDGTFIRGVSGKSDLLHRLNEEILGVLEANLES